MTNDPQAHADTTTQVTVPTPRLALTARYTPRICAHPGCTLPPHTTWTIRSSGRMYDRWWTQGDTLDLCGIHEQDDGQPTRTATAPAQRRP